MELDAWLAEDNTSEETKKAYEYFMKPEPRDIAGDLETDPRTGIRSRLMRIGMVRGSKDEDKKVVRVYLDPIPHIQIEDGKPLQGWYKSKHEDAGVRNRPCLLPDALVDTPDGPRRIDGLRKGDRVWGYNLLTGEYVITYVEATLTQVKSEYLGVVLDNGRVLRLTPEHEVWTRNRGWVEAGGLTEEDEILNLKPLGEFLSGTPVSDGVKRSTRVKSVDRIREETPVHDIQTGTHNFFSEDVLVSNCFSEAVLTQPYGGFCQVGCAFAVYSGEWIDTPLGPKKVDEVLIGDFIWGRSPEGIVPNQVTAKIRKWSPEGIEITLSSGQRVRVNGEHPVWAPARGGWIEARNLRSGDEVESFSESRILDGVKEARKLDGDIGLFGGPGGAPAPIFSGGVTSVVGVRSVPSGTVYDLETATENYYLKGSETPESPALLVHNCYINSGFKGYRGSGLVSVPMGYGDQVRKSLKKMQSSAAGYFSSFTDPFLPLEDVYHNTEEGATAFVNEGLPVFFLSRIKYPSWAFDILKKNPYSYAQKSINCPNQEDWKKLSPGAASLATHMEDIRELRKAGIYVSIQVNPIIPGVVNHEDVERTFEMLAEAGANHVIVKFVEAGYSWAPAMAERIRFRFGEERGSKFESLFTENIGGQRTIVEEYRLEGHRRYREAATRMGLTYATCYEYRMERDAFGRVTNKTGVSVGREFLTADQCHGHRVPMFTRKTPDAPFKEVEECPPTGCLHCADDNDGKARCGSELFGAAAALRYPDLKVGVHSPTPAARRKSLPILGNPSPSPASSSIEDLFGVKE